MSHVAVLSCPVLSCPVSCLTRVWNVSQTRSKVRSIGLNFLPSKEKIRKRREEKRRRGRKMRAAIVVQYIGLYNYIETAIEG